MADNMALAQRLLAQARDMLKTEEERLSQELTLVRSQLQAISAVTSMQVGLPVQLDVSEMEQTRSADSSLVATPSASMAVPTIRWRKVLDGMTHEEALLRIAKENNGVIRTAEAAHILVDAGRVKGNPRNANSHVHRMLRNSRHFVWTEPGVFRVLDLSDDLGEGPQLQLPSSVVVDQDMNPGLEITEHPEFS